MLGVKKQRDKVVNDVTKWLGELDRGPRGTLFLGMLHGAAVQVEVLLRQCINVYLSDDRELTQAALAAVNDGKGRSIARMTFGDCSKMLQYLDSRRKLAHGRRLIGKRDKELLDRTVKLRNRLTHGSAADTTGLESASAFLEDVLAVCSLPVVSAAVLRDAEQRATGDR
jgi:hypothetical protein